MKLVVYFLLLNIHFSSENLPYMMENVIGSLNNENSILQFFT